MYLAEYADRDGTIHYSVSKRLSEATSELTDVSAYQGVRHVYVYGDMTSEEVLNCVYGEVWWENYTFEDVYRGMDSICYKDGWDEISDYIKSKYSKEEIEE